MSAQWMGYFFDDTDLEGSKLLLCLAIADHADSTGKCRPGMSLLAKKIRLKERQTRQLLKEIVADGHVEIVSGQGRGHFSGFQLKKRQSVAPFTDEEKRQSTAAFMDEKRGEITDIKGAVPRIEKGQSHGATLYEPFKEPIREPKKEKSSTKKSKVQEDLKTRPVLEDQEWLIHLRSLPENRGIDIDALYLRMLAWCEKRQVTPSRLRLLNWLRGEQSAVPITYLPVSNGNSHKISTETPVARDLKPSRPAAVVPIEQTHVWNAFRDAVKAQVHLDVFCTWFKPLIFDGVDGEKMTLKVRTREVTYEWIQNYYPQQIYDALSAAGLGDFTLEWEVEPEEFEEMVSV